MMMSSKHCLSCLSVWSLSVSKHVFAVSLLFYPSGWSRARLSVTSSSFDSLRDRLCSISPPDIPSHNLLVSVFPLPQSPAKSSLFFVYFDDAEHCLMSHIVMCRCAVTVVFWERQPMSRACPAISACLWATIAAWCIIPAVWQEPQAIRYHQRDKLNVGAK